PLRTTPLDDPGTSVTVARGHRWHVHVLPKFDSADMSSAAIALCPPCRAHGREGPSKALGLLSRPPTRFARRLRRRREERHDVAADHAQSAAHHRQARADDQRRDRQDLAGLDDVLVPVLTRYRL